jgi:hypothetical protein
MNARLILFNCAECQAEVRQEPASENGSVQLWCLCGSHTFPAANIIPTRPEEWSFVMKKVSRGIRDAKSEFDARVTRLMISDHVRSYRDKFEARKGRQ